MERKRYTTWTRANAITGAFDDIAMASSEQQTPNAKVEGVR